MAPTAVSAYAAPPAFVTAAPLSQGSDAIDWRRDYASARQKAIDGRQFLGIVFHHSSPAEIERWQTDLQRDLQLATQLANYTWALLPLEHPPATSPSHDAADRQTMRNRLIDHPCFGELRGRPGVAIVDLRDADSPHFRQVVSVLPSNFPSPQIDDESTMLPSPDLLRTLLALPEGSLTERTLVLAIRTHPEQPQSAVGTPHPLLRAEAARHARLQARLGQQGHHDWDRRFAEINSRLPPNVVAQEVCAEGWSGQGLVAAALECVRSWRQSPGHWQAVSERHHSYGFDMHQGANGVWYATGVFARYR